jgi:tetratricopeptide (TPR) repeat protein
MACRGAVTLLATAMLMVPGFAASAQDAAQPPSDPCASQPAVCGKKEFDQGVAAYQKGDFASAAQHFRQALAYRPHPVVAFNLALAEGKLGQWRQAVARLDLVLHDPQTSEKLKASAAQERDSFAANLGSVTVDAVDAKGIEAWVDGEPLIGAPPRVTVDPGVHQVKVVVDGRVVIDRPIGVKAAEHVRLAITREREVSVVMPPEEHRPPPRQEPERSGVDPIWFYGGLGLTAVLGGVTTWSALDTRRAYDDYRAALPTLPHEDINRRVDEGHHKEDRTNVLLAGSLVAAAGTAVLGLLFVDWKASSGRPTMGLTPGGVVVQRRF